MSATRSRSAAGKKKEKWSISRYSCVCYVYYIHTFEHKYKNAYVCMYYIHIITHRAAKVRPVDAEEGR